MKHLHRSVILVCVLALTGQLADAKPTGRSTPWDLRDAVVRVITPRDNGRNYCSGVCVAPGGLVLTAGHCRPGNDSRIDFGDRTLSARLVNRPSGREGVAVLRVAAETSLPFVPVAESPPEPGDRVFSIGYPAGQWARKEGRVKRVTTLGGRRVIEASFRILEGTSGGPLFNEAGEVVGIASGRSPLPDELRFRALQHGRPFDPRQAEPASFWLHTAEIDQALQTAAPSPSSRTSQPAANGSGPRLYLFTQPSLCAPCRRLERDRRQNADGLGSLLARFDVREVRWRFVGWSPAEPARAFESRFGKIPGTPAFWVEGASEFLAGYPPETGNRRLQEYLGRFASQPRNPPPEPAGTRSSPSVPESADRVDWSDVTVVLLVARQEVGRLRGAIRRKALDALTEPVERKIHELTDGRAALVLVSERTHPARFAAVERAAGLRADPVCVLVLVARQDIGLKGLIVAPIERIVAETLGSAPVDPIFERVHTPRFRAVRQALQTVEDEPAPAPPFRHGPADEPPDNDGSDENRPLDDLAVTGLTAWITERLKLIRKLRRLVRMGLNRLRR